MIFEFFIAKKQILDKKRQSLIAIIGIAIGIIVLTVSIAISNGLNKNMIDSILSLSSHVMVTHRHTLEDYEEIADVVSTWEEVKGVTPKVTSQGIIRYNGVLGEFATGVKFEGVDFSTSLNSLNLEGKITRGAIDPKNLKGILVGEELYKNLVANIGDPISLISSRNKELPLEIMGTFKSGYYDFDTSMILIPLRTAQYITERDGTITSLDINLYNPYDDRKIATRIAQQWDTPIPSTWGDRNENLLRALALEKTVMVIGFSLIVVIASFVVWVILNMLVREKIRYIGIMRSMGISNKSIVKIFLIQGSLLGLAGIILGTLISLFLLWYIKTYSLPGVSSIYYLAKVPVELSLKEFLRIIFSNIFLIFLSSIFPAYRAGNLKIVEALKHD